MRAVAVVMAAMLGATGVANAQVARNTPVCRADRTGPDLVTRIIFPDGYVVEGPWRVTGVVKSSTSTSMTAVLNHIVETTELSPQRQLVDLPGPVQMTFSGRSMTDVLTEAANVWCATVIKARPGTPPASADASPPSPNRIM